MTAPANPATPAPISKFDALTYLRQQGGHAFLSAAMTKQISEAFGLTPPILQKIDTERGLPKHGYICAQLAAEIADAMGAPEGQRPYDKITDYNALNLAACKYIADAIGATWEEDKLDATANVGLRFDRLNASNNPIWLVVWVPTGKVLETLPELTTADQAQLAAMAWAAKIESGEASPL